MTGCYSAGAIQLSLAINFLVLKMPTSLPSLAEKMRYWYQKGIIFFNNKITRDQIFN